MIEKQQEPRQTAAATTINIARTITRTRKEHEKNTREEGVIPAAAPGGRPPASAAPTPAFALAAQPFVGPARAVQVACHGPGYRAFQRKRDVLGGGG